MRMYLHHGLTLTAAAALWLGLAVQQAEASQVVLTHDDRSDFFLDLQCDGDPDTFFCTDINRTTRHPPEPFADWEYEATVPDFPIWPFTSYTPLGLNRSSVSDLSMSGFGQGVYSRSPYHWFEHDPVFDVTFTVVDPTQVHLTGLLSTDYTSRAGEAAASIRLFGPGGENVFAADNVSPIGSASMTSINFQGILPPGSHRLFAYTVTSASPLGTRAEYEFDLSISPLIAPEPGTAILLGLGLIGLTRRRLH